MERSKMHKLLDVVLDIVEGGKGIAGYPCVTLEVTNYGGEANITIMDKGFVKGAGYDGWYRLSDYVYSQERVEDQYAACMKHLCRLKKGNQKMEPKELGDGWVYTVKALPVSGSPVLVLDGAGNECQTRYSQDSGFCGVKDVVAWMLLPEPVRSENLKNKEEEENEN